MDTREKFWTPDRVETSLLRNGLTSEAGGQGKKQEFGVIFERSFIRKWYGKMRMFPLQGTGEERPSEENNEVVVIVLRRKARERG